MRLCHFTVAFKIGNGARELNHAVVRARRKVEFLRRLIKDSTHLFFKRYELLKVAHRHVAVGF